MSKVADKKLEVVPVKEQPKEEFISVADFTTIKDMRTKNAFIASRAEKAILESRVSEAELRNAILNVYVKYGLTVRDSIDETSGKILRNTETPEDPK
ncbi:MAG TPA: hypothetical protein VM577_04365 [Anaerovoracaceae bacterium]|nr:hypothetical protein [Anaerovoracaceae bacterium]